MSKTTKILVAVHELSGGTKDGRAVAKPGEELDAPKLKALGLDNEAVAALVASGAVREVDARVASANDKPANPA